MNSKLTVGIYNDTIGKFLSGTIAFDPTQERIEELKEIADNCKKFNPQYDFSVVDCTSDNFTKTIHVAK